MRDLVPLPGYYHLYRCVADDRTEAQTREYALRDKLDVKSPQSDTISFELDFLSTVQESRTKLAAQHLTTVVLCSDLLTWHRANDVNEAL